MNPLENKYSSWMITINLDLTWDNDKYDEIKQNLKGVLEELCSTFVFQFERGHETRRYHIQGCFKTHIRKRQKTLLNELQSQIELVSVEQITLDRMRGTYDQAVIYCTKLDTRCDDMEPVIHVSDSTSDYMGSDINFLLEEENRYPWQNKIIAEIYDDYPHTFKNPDDRSIYWIHDPCGNSGKSKFVKCCCFYNDNAWKITYGTSAQLRSSIIEAGIKQCYFIDLPRVKGSDDSINSIISAIEDCKNGFVTSPFYGQSKKLMFDPLHIIIFSNDVCPADKLSMDRWVSYFMSSGKELYNASLY